jgi:hypothetical protein
MARKRARRKAAGKKTRRKTAAKGGRKAAAKSRRKPTRRAAAPRRAGARRRKPAARAGRKKRKAAAGAGTPSPGRRRPAEERLQGPPPREATLMRSDRQRASDERLAEYTSTSPRLSGGDVDADWERAGSTGEEAVGGSVATPDQDVVDELGDALGVGRSPDAPVRSSEEILRDRDVRRHRRDDQAPE